MKKILFLLLAASRLNAADFPALYNSEPDKSSPMPGSEALAKLKLPAGFKATLFAAEPDVQNPIAMTWDARGRLWVAENYTYAERAQKFDLRLRDRVLIFEDTDGDGRFDTRKVFTDEVQMLTSVEVGRGGVWLMCPPQMIFIPDRNGDDVPDGAPEVVLDGFTVPPENYHNFANGLRFGPDGWLYGRCGASSPGEIGAPGTPADQRIPMRGTIWRYHPQRKVVEALSGGTTNPWGHDWDEHGELFFINTVNGHLWHGFAGAHFVRPHTIDPNPRTYGLIDQHADHWHFDTAEGWTKSRDGKADALGGGHAHVGMMIYQGDNWPAEYRGRLLTWNMHGHRANQEILERQGSGYVGRHGPDFMLAGDPWFRGMEFSYGPDGGVFVLDWSDTGECHESTGVHRTSGRIYKITYGDPKRVEIGDLAKLSVSELVQLHTHSNEWFSRQSRLELAGRTMTARGLGNASELLRGLFKNQGDVVVKLRALWTLYAVGAADEAFLRAQLRHSDEHVRAWAVRLLSDSWPLDTTLSQRPSRGPEGREGMKLQALANELRNPQSEMIRSLGPSADCLAELVDLARTDPSGLVRLALASTLQRLPTMAQRLELAGSLAVRKEDASDHNLPMLIWYGLIPVADADSAGLAKLAAKCELPLTRKFIARRLAEDIERNPAPLNELLTLTSAKPEVFQSDILDGVADGLTGWRKAKKPAVWDAFAQKLANAANTALRDRVRDLSVVFGDGRALGEVKKVALDKDADLNVRKVALQTLIDNRPPDLRQLCEQLLDVRFLNPVAARGLATFDDPAIGVKLARAYRQFHPSEQAQLLATLVSRPTFADALLTAVAERRIPRADISPFHARQMRSLNDAVLNKKLAEVWGEFRDSTADKQELIAKWKAQFTPAALTQADKSRGRVIFNTACASCHALYGEGGKIGPDLTGGGRDNLDYLLENIADPSAVVTADFRMSVVNLKDGRVLNALVAGKTERTLTLKTMTETLTVERGEVGSVQESSLSLMPEGLLEALTPDQARDLIAYLMLKSQVPLPADAKSGAN
jgi:putative membrane-bound dehydrogenase-like protein